MSRQLEQLGISSDAIHGNKSQNARQKALNSFRSGETRALVATDVAARGIDVDGVTHVINFEIPNEPESYVHRIGRTARAGAAGSSLSFCDHEERAYLKDIEKSIRQPVPVLTDHPFHAEGIAGAPAGEESKPAMTGRRSRGARNGRRASAPGTSSNQNTPRRAGAGAPANSQRSGAGKSRSRNRRPQRTAA